MMGIPGEVVYLSNIKALGGAMVVFMFSAKATGVGRFRGYYSVYHM